jgi:hypothetical protein
MADPIAISVSDIGRREYRSARSVLIENDAKGQPIPKKPVASALLGWALFVGVAAGLFVYVRSQGPVPTTARTLAFETPSEPWSWAGILVAAGYAWLVLVVIVVGQFSRKPRGRGAVAYVFSDDGVAIKRPFEDVFFNWEVFNSVAETDHVFVLRFSRSEGLIVPKRGVADAAELARLRELINKHGTRAPVAVHTGFEVA